MSRVCEPDDAAAPLRRARQRRDASVAPRIDYLYRLYQLALDNKGASDVMVAGMIVLLALVFLRFQDPELRLRP